ncbi:MAG: glycoside hydrolase family 32 protein, partial [Verrucomicrobiota bacterium]
KEGEKGVRFFDTDLSTAGTPDWYAICDVREFVGKPLTITSDSPLPETVIRQLSSLFLQSDVPVREKDLYQEALRPQFHFTVKRGWNNDPNGLCYFNGEYHLFYQYIPTSLMVGDFRYMHWGHAVSPDLVHWTELSPAIHPVDGGIYSGGAYVDKENRSGFGKGKEEVLLVTYTGTGERIAYATGRAETFQEPADNPIVRHRGRDPKILYYPPKEKWIMIVFEEEEGVPAGYAFYDSKDLKSWRRMFQVDGGHECPDFFEMPVQGGESKWVIGGALRGSLGKEKEGKEVFYRSTYRVGTFDGEKFIPETDWQQGVIGPSFYAGQTFSNTPDGRRILIGWLQNDGYPGMAFTQGMTLPMEMKLHKTEQGYSMTYFPVKEIELLHEETVRGENLNMAAANQFLEKGNADLLDIDLEIAMGKSSKFEIGVRGGSIQYNASTKELSVKGTKEGKTSIALMEGKLKLRILLDRSTLDVFVNDGVAAFNVSGAIFQKPDPLKINADPDVTVTSIVLSRMKSAWQESRAK